jgi:signal transduction histidine kinase
MAESLQQAEERRRALTADIAHELRTPLAVQRANLEAMQDGVYTLDQENLARILEQNNLLTSLVEDLRTLALTDANELQLTKQSANLYTLAAQVIDQFNSQAQSKQVTFHLHAKEIIPKIQIDTRRVEQILHNLVNNALRYTPAGGHITLSIQTYATSLTVEVRDTGHGIPPESLPHIFERFYRADPARSRDSRSTGLGLTIARRLAQAHGGDLTAANHPDGGAVFTLSLPKIKGQK